MSNVYETPEWAAWLASIREMPDDDNRRLFAADFLEDNGEGERAEFVRCQVELAKTPELVWRNKLLHKAEWQAIRPRAEPWGERFELASPSDAIGVYHYRETNQNHARLYGRVSALADGIYGPTLGPLALAGGTWQVDRGFITRVSGPLASLIGEKRRHCEGGYFGYPRSGVPDCPVCDATGYRTPGVLRELVKREPVMKFEVTDREPMPSSGRDHTGPCIWWDANHQGGSTIHPQSDLPTDLFFCLEGEHLTIGSRWYPTADAARAALSAALLRLVQPAEVPT